jgi:hypothetical protein
MKIVIIGAGWYGLYLCKKLSEIHGGNVQIIIIERESDIFVNNASVFNQCRLHLGFHYPRSHDTRKLCLEGFDRFMDEFPHLTYEIPNNWYVISENSLIDFQTFNAIFSYENYDYELYDTKGLLNNVECDRAVTVKERGINPKLAAEYFHSILQGSATFLFNHQVLNIGDNHCITGIKDDGKEFAESFDVCFDCTNFQILKPENVVFERTITLVYRKTQQVPFGALTVMDGLFFSIFPYDPGNNLYSLTHVKHSVLQNDNFNVAQIRSVMEADVIEYFPSFLQCFEYVSFFTSPKTKPLSKSDSRRLMIINDDEKDVISVSCGKITGIFQMIDELLSCFSYF